MNSRFRKKREFICVVYQTDIAGSMLEFGWNDGGYFKCIATTPSVGRLQCAEESMVQIIQRCTVYLRRRLTWLSHLVESGARTRPGILWVFANSHLIELNSRFCLTIVFVTLIFYCQAHPPRIGAHGLSSAGCVTSYHPIADQLVDLTCSCRDRTIVTLWLLVHVVVHQSYWVLTNRTSPSDKVRRLFVG